MAEIDTSLTRTETTTKRHVAHATWALFVGLAMMLLAAGLFGSLLGVRAERAKVATLVSGVMSAAYYIGFLTGARFALRALTRVGHIRAYAALASGLSAAMVTVGLTGAPAAWIALRFVTGLCMAGQYVVAESWLNDLATNANRGRLLAVYSLVTTGAFGIGQVLLFSFDTHIVTGFAVAGIVASLAVAPVALSEAAIAPVIEDAEPISLRELARVVPTGVGSCAIVGAAHGALAGMGALYATRIGMPAHQIGLFLALPSVGGMILQWPISAAADELDRRAVGVGASAIASACAAGLLLGHEHRLLVFVLITMLGAFTYPLYSIAAAYTNDWIDPEHVNAAASQLVSLYGLGAVVGPLIATGLLIVTGPNGFFWSLFAIHAILAGFFLYRMVAWRSPLAKVAPNELSLPARVFFIPATIVGMSRRPRRRTR